MLAVIAEIASMCTVASGREGKFVDWVATGAGTRLQPLRLNVSGYRRFGQRYDIWLAWMELWGFRKRTWEKVQI